MNELANNALANSFAFNNAWLIPALPFFSFLLVGLFIRPYSEKLAGIVATLSVSTSAALSLWLAFDYFSAFPAGAEHPALVSWSFQWLRYNEYLVVNVGTLIDSLSILLMVVVTFVSSLVHLYSIGYMKGEDGYGRYFTYLNLFTFSMLGLVVAPNILQTYIFWELVGVSSFLLIGFYYTKPSAVAASKKAFIVTRFADLFFLVGILLIAVVGYNLMSLFGVPNGLPENVSAFDFAFITNSGVSTMMNNFGILTPALILIFIGAAGKSALFPLHIWLPDAMEGPTPVSALIHAATMVVAGVYLVARLFVTFAASESALLVAAYLGAFTCIFAAIIACTQNDIKRVLAYSTLSQIGYMMFALGVASATETLGYTASLFHLFTHAFFKALLFLGAGAVIHSVHTNNIWNMGGLAKKMPITNITFLIATLAISGVWPFAGFFSKDEIIAAAFGNHHYVIFAIGLLVAGITAFYMFRIYIVTFLGKARSEAVDHAHEAPMTMTIPLMILAALTAVVGFIHFGDYVSVASIITGDATGHAEGGFPIWIPALLSGLTGIGIAWFMYGGEKDRATAVTEKLGVIYRVICAKFYIDEIYQFITHKIIIRFISTPIAWFDKRIVDGGVDLTGWLTRRSGATLSHLQTGQTQTYAAWLINGVIAVVVIIWLYAS